MLTLFREGGFPMWFLLAFGLLLLGTSGLFAFRPTLRAFRLTLALGTTTLFTAITGVLSALGTVGHQAHAYLQAHPELSLPQVLLQGFAESMSAGILGFTILSLAALFIAVGVSRAPRFEE